MRDAAAKTPPPVALHQIAALPLRERDGVVEVCLVTTRETGRWSLPKGWPMKGRRDFAAAKVEAEQEAGVVGKPEKTPLGSFVYWKRRDDHFDLIRVAVYALRVRKILATWKEQAERQVRWMTLGDAAVAVEEPSLTALLLEIEARVEAQRLAAARALARP